MTGGQFIPGFLNWGRGDSSYPHHTSAPGSPVNAECYQDLRKTDVHGGPLFEGHIGASLHNPGDVDTRVLRVHRD